MALTTNSPVSSSDIVHTIDNADNTKLVSEMAVFNLTQSLAAQIAALQEQLNEASKAASSSGSFLNYLNSCQK